MGRTITYTETLETTTCWCGINFAVPGNLLRHAHNGDQTIYCPLGHRVSWDKIDHEKKLKAQLAEKERQLEAARATQARLRDEVVHEQARVRGYQGALGKAKKRAARGVCPASGCKRSFVDVAAHVATCHPELVTSDGAA